ncbi:MAG: MBL fold metallo-hydrolase [Parachlamydiales bacterium]
MSKPYDPEGAATTSQVKLWGTRGSIPVSGPQYAHYGGNTVCLEVRQPEHLVIIDAGTGIRELGEELIESPYRELHLFIGHAHWDHIIGFPFFKPVYDPEFTLHIYGPGSNGETMEKALKRILQPHHFPVRLEQLQARLHFHELGPGDRVDNGPITVQVAHCDHPGSALGFRIEVPGLTFGYVTDNEFLKGHVGHPSEVTRGHPMIGEDKRLLDMLQGVNLLIHEAQYTPKEYMQKIGWGHSSISNATALVHLCGVRNWIVTHHDPNADDETLRKRLALHLEVLEECGMNTEIRMAYDGLRFPLKT